MEEPPEAPYNQGVIIYVKKIATYVSDLAANLLGFARDREAPAELLGKDLDRLSIKMRRPMEGCDRKKTWKRNTGQSREPS